MLERDFQTQFINDVQTLLDGCVVVKNDSGYLQGIPDWLVLYEDKWAMLEIKASAKAKKQPNQDYYIDMFNEMSFAAFVYPENAEDILHALQQAFRPRGSTRVSKR